MRTTTDQFHHMRGHVSDGCEIVSPSGKVFTLRMGHNGWMIYGDDGLAVSGYLPAYYDVERFVVVGLSQQ